MSLRHQRNDSLKNKKQQSERVGRLAEMVACFWLRAQGFRILARRFRPPYGYGNAGAGAGARASEIDIIAQRKNLLLFVEVKFRKKRTDAIFSLTDTQQQAIATTAELFLSRHMPTPPEHVRFDAIFFTPYRLPLHLKNAWQVQ